MRADREPWGLFSSRWVMALVRASDSQEPPLKEHSRQAEVQAVLQQALARIDEAGHRFAQCLLRTHR